MKEFQPDFTYGIVLNKEVFKVGQDFDGGTVIGRPEGGDKDTYTVCHSKSDGSCKICPVIECTFNKKVS